MQQHSQTTRAPVGSAREVLTVAWPLIVSMLGHTAIGLVDALMVSPLGGAAVGAVGLGHAVSLVPFCGGFGLLNGARVAVAQSVGAGDASGAREVVRQALLIALQLGLLVASLVPAAGVLVEWAGAHGELRDGARAWLAVRLLGMPLQFMAMALGAGFDGQGQTQVTMRINVVANLLNVGLCLILVPGLGPLPALGVVGTAWATLCANAAQLAMVALAWRGSVRQASPLAGRAASPALRATLRRRILTLGGPTALQWSLEVISWTVVSALLTGFEPSQLAAHTIVSRVVGVSFLPGHGIGEAVGILVGQCVGARDPAAARRVVRGGVRAVVLLMGVMGIGFAVFGQRLLAPFVLGDAATALGLDLLLVAAAFQVFDGTALVAQAALNGAGDSRFTMASGLTLTWVFWVPLSVWYGVHERHGAAGAWAALMAHVVAMSMVWGLRWRSGEPLRRALDAPGVPNEG